MMQVFQQAGLWYRFFGIDVGDFDKHPCEAGAFAPVVLPGCGCMLTVCACPQTVYVEPVEL